ncbi:9035_t:CDS:1, partial [Acaulospora colombiana]
MIIRAYRSNRTSFSPLQLIRLDPRPLFTYSLILAFLAQFAHDFLLCYINYRGYVINSSENSNINASAVDVTTVT